MYLWWSFMHLVFTRMPGESEDVPLVEFMHLVFTRMPGESEDVPLVEFYAPCIYPHAR